MVSGKSKLPTIAAQDRQNHASCVKILHSEKVQPGVVALLHGYSLFWTGLRLNVCVAQCMLNDHRRHWHECRPETQTVWKAL